MKSSISSRSHFLERSTRATPISWMWSNLFASLAAQLPDYTRRTTALSKVAIDVRHALLSAHEPVTLLFSDLPQACGFPPFSPQEQPDEGRVDGFISVFRDALGELRQAYPALLSRIVERASQAAGESPWRV